MPGSTLGEVLGTPAISKDSDDFLFPAPNEAAWTGKISKYKESTESYQLNLRTVTEKCWMTLTQHHSYQDCHQVTWLLGEGLVDFAGHASGKFSWSSQSWILSSFILFERSLTNDHIPVILTGVLWGTQLGPSQPHLPTWEFSTEQR